MDGAVAARESLLPKGLGQARGKADWGEAERREEGVPGRGDVGSKSVQVGLLEHMPGQGRLTRLGGAAVGRRQTGSRSPRGFSVNTGSRTPWELSSWGVVFLVRPMACSFRLT